MASWWQNKRSPPRLEGTKVFEGSPSVLISMNKQYVICIKNDNYKATLELRKVYQVVNDKQTPGGLIRVVDETGEDFLLPENLFVPISVPQAAETIFSEPS